MKRRRVSLIAALATCAALLSGCVGEPAPVETTPLFANEDEAFAAAEATYRAYVDALNQVDLSDPATFEPVFAWTTGDASAASRETFSAMHADEWKVGGESVVSKVQPVTSHAAGSDDLRMDVCLNVSTVTLADATGASVVSPDRPDLQTMQIEFTSGDSSTGLLIAKFDSSETESVCKS